MGDVRMPNLNRALEGNWFSYHLETDIKEGLILFYGDSMFTRWKPKYDNRSLEEDIRMKDGSLACVNHGFGGSTAEELLYYYPLLVRPWKPRALVLKAYGNDMMYGYSPEEVLSIHARTLEYARHDMPGIKLYLCNIAPNAKPHSPAGDNHRDEYNRLVKAYCEAHPDTTLVDHSSCEDLFQPGHVGDYNFPREELYIDDHVHFNQAGYDIYKKFFLKVLDDIL